MKTELKYTEEVISPEDAQYVLENYNTRNRQIRPSHVNNLARVMEKGGWVLNSESIAFDTNGALINGQHRLLAVIQCGSPQKFTITRGVAPHAFDTLDDGNRRDIGDVLSIEKITNNNDVGRAIIWIKNYNERFGPLGEWLHTRAERLSNAELHDYFNNNIHEPTLQDGVHWHKEINRVFRGLGQHHTAAVYYIMARASTAAEADDFFNKLVKGTDLSEEDPILILRNKFTRIISSRVNQGAKNKMVKNGIPACTIIAWNAYRQGRTMSRLNLPKWRGRQIKGDKEIRGTFPKVL